MENVLGLGFHDAATELELGLARLPKGYKIIGPAVLDAADFGAATKRKRLFLIGYDPKRCDGFSLTDIHAKKKKAIAVAEAIADLKSAKELPTEGNFDLLRIDGRKKLSEYAKKLASPDRLFTGDMRTAHTPKVVERFVKVKRGETDTIGRHLRLAWHGQCPSVRSWR